MKVRSVLSLWEGLMEALACSPVTMSDKDQNRVVSERLIVRPRTE